LREIAQIVARTDMLDRFLRDMKARMTAAVRPQTAAQAAPRA
jgi:hypothetical protein